MVKVRDGAKKPASYLVSLFSLFTPSLRRDRDHKGSSSSGHRFIDVHLSSALTATATGSSVVTCESTGSTLVLVAGCLNVNATNKAATSRQALERRSGPCSESTNA